MSLWGGVIHVYAVCAIIILGNTLNLAMLNGVKYSPWLREVVARSDVEQLL